MIAKVSDASLDAVLLNEEGPARNKNRDWSSRTVLQLTKQDVVRDLVCEKYTQFVSVVLVETIRNMLMEKENFSQIC